MKKFHRSVLYLFTHVPVVGLLAFGQAGNAFSQADFYKGKQLRLFAAAAREVPASSKRERWFDFWKSIFPASPI